MDFDIQQSTLTLFYCEKVKQALIYDQEQKCSRCSQCLYDRIYIIIVCIIMQRGIDTN